MIRYSSRVIIDRSPREVFVALTDPARYDQWTDMVDVRFDTTGEPKVGTRGQFRLANGPIKGPLTAEIVELVPDRQVVFRVGHPWLAWTSVSSLEPMSAGTELVYAGEVSLRGWRRILEPLMAREVRTGEAREARRLKQLLEREVATASTAVAS